MELIAVAIRLVHSHTRLFSRLISFSFVARTFSSFRSLVIDPLYSRCQLFHFGMALLGANNDTRCFDSFSSRSALGNPSDVTKTVCVQRYIC